VAESLLDRVDHLVYATTDLDRTLADLEDRLGLAATPGGRHPGRGTRNALIALGPHCYLEVIGPDPQQPPPTHHYWIGNLSGSRLVTWAAKGHALEHMVTEAVGRGVRLGAVVPGGRQRPDGVQLHWHATDPATIVADGLVPFFIDWGASPHPATDAAQGCQLTALRAEHPDAEGTRRALAALGMELPVAPGPKPTLIAMLECPRGQTELR
jgi:hypothetical protein